MSQNKIASQNWLIFVGVVVISVLAILGIIFFLRDQGGISFTNITNGTRALERDMIRLSEIDATRSALMFAMIMGNQDINVGEPKVVYLSLPSATAPLCDAPDLPSLPTGWTYRCASSANLTNIDGTGWLPVNFTAVERGSPIPFLPTDPINNSTHFYAYAQANAFDFELNMRLESKRERMMTDEGNRNECITFIENTCFYETGNDLFIF